MIKTVDFTGKTEEDAVAAGLTSLGLERDEVSVEIIERAKSGFFGFKSSPAVVRLSYEVPDPIPEPKPEEPKAAENVQRQEARPEKKEKKKFTKKAEAPKPAPTAAPAAEAAASSLSAKAKRTEEFLKGLFVRMDVSAEPVITETSEGIHVTLAGEDPGALIGRRGETLDAIQHLANYVVNRGSSNRTRISVDAENYRERRNEALEKLAKKMAAKAVKYRKNMTLEPMNSYERHVIHTALQGYNGITTYSIGAEPNRRIVVAYDRNSTGASSPAPRREEYAPAQQDKPNYREWS